ncbi:glycoside hydrolase family 10 protein [Actinopolymorpha alba]|uniref:glycoside hydrolase family 10 protein n=1 Tax=Actinopolymorpha alba TaxID=533267 RepID=UPI00036BC3BE|nr:family 10 glycosylhydrolase [Actinopolymorpha alba]
MARARLARLGFVIAAAILAANIAVAPSQASGDLTVGGASVPTSCPAPDPATPKRQFRASWIASVANIDWPSRPGLTVEEQKVEYLRLLDDAQSRRLNAVVVQVRPTADAFWPSAYEPWSEWLTGTQGQDPGYDPLAFLVAEAHARNLEFHAWFNPYRVSMQADPSRLSPDHPGRQHPDWLVPYAGKLYYNPGIPEARRFVEDAILDAVQKYDIDGVHFDDYFYPYPSGTLPFDDEATFARYGSGFADKASWRRHNIDLLVSELSQRIKKAKPWVKFGISPFAVWRNVATDPEGSNTRAGVQTYDDLAADTRRWVREEWIDYIVPQVYWNIGFTPADYAILVPWWSEQVEGTNVQLFVGQATYKVGTSTQDPAWSDPREMTRHLAFNRDYPQVRGDIYFSAKDVRADRLDNMSILAADHYSRPALIPVMTQLPDAAPARPALTGARRTPSGVRISWVDTSPRSRRATSFAIYRFDGTERVDRLDPCAFADASRLVTTVRATDSAVQGFLDGTARPGQAYTYAVTALDRGHHESAPSIGRVVQR